MRTLLSISSRFFGSLVLLTQRVRDFFINNRKAGVALLVLLTSVFLYYNWYVFQHARGGILENPILNQEDPVFKSDKYVSEHTGFADAFKVVVRCPEGVTQESLGKLLTWTERFRYEFGDGVISLSRGIPDTRVEDGVVYVDPYISREDLTRLDIEAWKERMRSDPAYGLLVERDFSALYIIVNLQRGYNDSDVLWRTAELLEGRKISFWERLYKADIYPTDPDLMVAGWPVGRGLLYQILNTDMFGNIGSLGIPALFFLFWLALGSWTQAAFSTLVVVLSMLWMRGTIGLLRQTGLGEAMLGLPIRETVYILIPLSACIVQGVSFSLHKFEAFNRTGSWDGAKEVDPLIFNTALISIFGFVTLWTFEVRSIRELGLISGIGIFYLLVLATVFIPSVAKIRPVAEEEKAGAYSRLIEKLCEALGRLACVRPAWYLGITGFLVVLALLFIFLGRLKVETRPLEYIPGTLVFRTAEFLNAEGRSGFAPASFYLESRSDVYDPDFIGEVADFHEAISRKAREVFSIEDYVQKLSLQLESRQIPESRGAAMDMFSYLEDGTPPEVRLQNWTEQGVRLFAFIPMSNSREIRKFNDFVAEAGRRQFRAFSVYPFGDAPLYAQEDLYITKGKPENVGWSQVVLAVFFTGLIYWKSRRLKSCRLSPLWSGVVMNLPFLFASAVSVLLMMALRIPLDVATAVISALAINASVDFSIYFVDAFQEALARTGDVNTALMMAMKEKGGIIISDIVLNAACFSPLIRSSFIPISRLGWMMVVMIVASGIGSLVIMPSVLRLAVRRQRQERSEI